MSDGIEQRRYARAPVSLKVQVRLATGVLVEGQARNVSLNGLFFETERSLPLGSRVKIKMTVENGDRKTIINCAGEVSRLDEFGVAIEMDAINEEGLNELCALMREAARDAVLLDDEFEKRLDSGYALRRAHSDETDKQK